MRIHSRPVDVHVRTSFLVRALGFQVCMYTSWLTCPFCRHLCCLCAHGGVSHQMFPDDPVTPIEKRAPSTNPVGKFFEGLLSPVNTAGMKGPEIEPPPPPPPQ